MAMNVFERLFSCVLNYVGALLLTKDSDCYGYDYYRKTQCFYIVGV